jgi:hypothetical protein
MKLTPWFQIGTDGPPVRSGMYEFEIWLKDDFVFHLHAVFTRGSNYIITDDGRIISLTYEDHWRGVLK